jgi:hypothetical protein
MKRRKSQFRINDRVVITDSGECFTGYSQMFDELGFRKLDLNPAFEEGTSARIFNMCQHPHSDCWLIAVVDDEGNECLTSDLGVLMVKEGVRIKINDMVRVIKPGKTYTTNREMFIRMGFEDIESNSAWNRGEIGRVFDISTYEYNNKTLYALLHADGSECLISAEGIELVREVVVDSATLTQILDRLAQLESKLDQLAKHTMQPAKPKTAVEWFADQLLGYDYNSSENECEILLSFDKYETLKREAMEMETKQNCK